MNNIANAALKKRKTEEGVRNRFIIKNGYSKSAAKVVKIIDFDIDFR